MQLLAERLNNKERTKEESRRQRQKANNIVYRVQESLSNKSIGMFHIIAHPTGDSVATYFFLYPGIA
jgi:hypothetical protein